VPTSANLGASMYRNKLAILASTALTMSLGLAQAADMPLKAPVYKAPNAVPYDPWTGFYLGGNLGYSWGNADTTTSVAPFTQDPFPFVFPGGISSTSTKPSGVIGGGQIGYNWRLAPQWIGGIEADFQGSGQRDSSRGLFSGIAIGTTANQVCNSSQTCNYTNTTDMTARLSMFGTIRGRVGTLFNNLLLYGTGGLAYGKLSVSGTNTFNVICSTCLAGVTTVTYSTPFSYSMTKAGWTLGAGIEGLLGVRNWTWKVEYLHIDLGSIGSGSFGTTPSVTLGTGKFTDEIVRVGLNYRVGAAPLP
jgi:outer membrane immunogenic protein